MATNYIPSFFFLVWFGFFQKVKVCNVFFVIFNKQKINYYFVAFSRSVALVL